MIRAGLVTDLARRLEAHLVHPHIAYLSLGDLWRPRRPARTRCAGRRTRSRCCAGGRSTTRTWT
ncbi:hypothetical protein QJS66_20840 [Kocuria rhizophila]|nr:hypothetical protein QJS66_20840 [Kocuria rhizophila]